MPGRGDWDAVTVVPEQAGPPRGHRDGALSSRAPAQGPSQGPSPRRAAAHAQGLAASLHARSTPRGHHCAAPRLPLTSPRPKFHQQPPRGHSRPLPVPCGSHICGPGSADTAATSHTAASAGHQGGGSPQGVLRRHAHRRGPQLSVPTVVAVPPHPRGGAGLLGSVGFVPKNNLNETLLFENEKRGNSAGSACGVKGYCLRGSLPSPQARERERVPLTKSGRGGCGRGRLPTSPAPQRGGHSPRPRSVPWVYKPATVTSERIQKRVRLHVATQGSVTCG